LEGAGAVKVRNHDRERMVAHGVADRLGERAVTSPQEQVVVHDGKTLHAAVSERSNGYIVRMLASRVAHGRFEDPITFADQN